MEASGSSLSGSVSSSGSSSWTAHPVWYTCARWTRMLMANPALHTIDQVPDNFKELFILSGYRSPRSSPWQCLSSIFAATNETLNFWTHFLPALYFIWQTVLACRLLDSEGDYAVTFFIGMITVCIFPTMSAIAHIFNTMSNRSRHICFFLDYASLGLYILGTGIAYRSYTFPRFMMGTWYSRTYLPTSAVLSVASLIVSCESRFLPPCAMKKMMRMLAFMLPYFYLSFPLMCRILLCEGDECSWTALLGLKRHFTFAFISAVLFGTHMPERFYPGRFDIIGHSHQLFHLCSVIGTSAQIDHLLQDFHQRRDLVLSHDKLPSTAYNIVLLILVILLNIVVLGFYIAKIYRFIPADDQDNDNSTEISSKCDTTKTQACLENNNKVKSPSPVTEAVRQRKVDRNS